MTFEMDSLRPAGAHFDETTPKVRFSFCEPQTIEIQIVDIMTNQKSHIVEVDVLALVGLLHAGLAQNVRMFSRHNESQAAHAKSCAECKGNAASQRDEAGLR